MKRILIVLGLITANIHLYPQNITETNELVMSGNYSEAIVGLNGLILSDSLNPDLYRKLAYCYSAADNYEKAISYLLCALELKPGDSRLLLMLGDNYMAYEKYGEAKAAYLKYMEQNIKSNDGQLRLAKAFIALKEWAAGENILKSLVEIKDSVPSYYEQLAKCQEALKEYDDAIVSLHKTIQLNPYSINNVIKLCNLYFRTERPVSAQRAADASLLYFPQNAELWRIKAEVLFKLDYYPEAVKSYRNALMYGDTSSTLYRNLGICFYASGKSDSAFLFLDTAFRKEDDDCITALYLGKALKDLNRQDEAVIYLEEVEAIQMNNYVIESFINLGVVYQLKKDYKTSVAYFNRALELDPERKSVLFRMAATYDEGYEDKTIALKYYKEYAGDTAKTDLKMYEYAMKRIKEINTKQ
jgi:tetratricopeptide (TPR) repeat protein